MKNKLSDLNDHLFAQLERLGDESLTEEQLERELRRTKAITAVSKHTIANARLVLDAEVQLADLPAQTEKPKLLS
jgi:hypothetical protein